MTSTTYDTRFAPDRAWRIAILEDDTQLREGILVPGLRYFGFEVTGVATAAELYRAMLAKDMDMVVLDVGLPGEDGISVLANLRELSNLGVVMITADGNASGHVAALAHGADAFLAKPVDVEILAATLHSLGRRMAIEERDLQAAAHSGRWQLDTEDWCLSTPAGKAVPLTAPERCILRILMASRDRPVSRDELIDALRRDVHDFEPKRIEMMIHRLRRKAQAASGVQFPLLTLRGHGYLFQELVDH
jgi:DNA-binding response OmpR family regulator